MMAESDAATMEKSIKDDLESNDVVADRGIDNNDDTKDAVEDAARGEFSTPELIEGGEGAMNRDVTEITTQSYGSKVKDSCSGVCFGFILYFASIALLIWNEGRTVKRMKDLDEGRDIVIEFDLNNFTNSSVPTTFENQLIHAIGDLNTPDIIMDPIFGISSQYNVTNSSNSVKVKNDNYLKLSRSISMYQWKESSTSKTKERLDGSTYTETTYSYSQAWSSSLIDSSRFRETSSSRVNPGSFPFEPFTVEADPVYLGNKIVLKTEITSSFNWYEPLDSIDLNNVPDASLRSRLTKYTSNGFFYRYDNTTAYSVDQPKVGDTRITFEVVVPDTISIIARLYPDTDKDGDHDLGSHTTNRGGQLLLIERGVYTAEEIFVQADNDNTATAWILRIVGFLMMVFSILLILQPLATIVDIVPFVGDFIQSSMENCLFPMIAVIIALPTCLFVVALAWLAYRPAIAIPIMMVSLCFIVFFYWKIHKKKQDQNNGSTNNDMNENDNDVPMKPNKHGNNSTSDTFSPFNSPGHNNINVSSPNGGTNDDTYVNSGAGGGFADALDHPQPPSTTTAYNDEKPSMDHKYNNNLAVEEDVVFK